MDIIYENKTSALYYWTDCNLATIPHFHKHIEIIYVKQGRTAAFADQKRYLLEAGDLFIAFPNQIHYYETFCCGEYMVLIFSPEIIFEAGAALLNSTADRNMIHAGREQEIAEIFSHIQKAGGQYANVALNGYCNLLMSHILPRLTLKTVNTGNNSTLHSILDFCLHNFREAITLDYAAEKLHLSKYYISRLINQNLDLSFNEYVNNLRVSEACTQLKETDKKIADISEDVGFGTIRSFNRAFRQIMDISPSEYRNSISRLL
jgi:AraC-like DNA-binding protein